MSEQAPADHPATRGKRPRWQLGIGVGVVIAVLVAVVVVVTRDDATSSSEAEATRQSVGVFVSLQRLVPGTSPAIEGEAFPVVVTASGAAPITDVELWATDTPVAGGPVETDGTSWRGRLDWTPPAGGPYVLSARARDAAGNVAVSNVLRVEAGPIAAPRLSIPVVTEEGQTPAGLAAAHGTDVGVVVEIVASAGVGNEAEPPGPDTTLPAGLELLLPVPDAVTQPLLDEQAAATASAAAAAADAESPDPGASAPKATAIDECGVDLEQTETGGGENGAGERIWHRLDPDTDTFRPVVRSSDARATDWPGPGEHFYVVETQVDGVWQMSPPAPIVLPDDCGGTWTGDISLRNGVLIGPPPDAASVAWLYLSLDGKTWTRLPEGQATVPLGPLGFDFSGLLPPLDGDEVFIEAWGRQGGVLVDLGSGQFRTDGRTPLGDSVGHGSGVELDIVTSIAKQGGAIPEQRTRELFEPAPETLLMRWSTGLPGVTHGMWQVTAYPVDEQAGPDVGGVIASGIVEGSGGLFEIDFGAFVASPPLDLATAAPLEYAAVAGPAAVARWSGSSDPSTTTPATGGEAAGLGTLTMGDAALSADQMIPLGLPPIEDYWVRLVPMAADQPAGAASNNVVVRTGDPELTLSPSLIQQLGDLVVDPDQIPYELFAGVNAPKPPNPGLLGCWTVTGFTEDWAMLFKDKQISVWKSMIEDLPPGTAICPGVCYSWYDQDGLVFGWPASVKTIWGGKCGGGSGGLLGFIGSSLVKLWDTVVHLFTTLKGYLVDLVVAVSGCEEIGGLFASKGDAAKACEVLATTAVNVALIYFGIPPSLPNSQELYQIAKGEMKTLVIEYAKSLGVPCDEIATVAETAGKSELTCDALVQEVLDELESQVQAAFRDAALQGTGISFPEGVDVAPHPGGQVQPPTINLSVRPTAGAPLGGKSCKAIMSMGSAWFPQLTKGLGFDHAVLAAGAGKQSPTGEPYTATLLPGFMPGLNPWAIPKKTYSGTLGFRVVDLPTDGLGYVIPASPGAVNLQPTAQQSYFLHPPTEYDAVQGATWTKVGNGYLYHYSPLPYSTLHLHDGAFVTFEVYSACTGLYRANFTLPRSFPAFASKVDS